MASNESSSVPARLKDLKDSVKERFLALLGIRQPKVLLEDEQEVFLQVGRTVWHAPRQLRIELWLSSLARRHSLVSEYQAYLSQEVTREAANDIEKDVQRTFPNTRRFHAEEGQTQLRNVLRAYAAYDPEVAYCQGMNFLTGLLLMYMPTEAHAFAALVVLMEDRKLRSFYHRSMSLLQVQLWQLSRLISPALNQRLEALGVVPMLYGASWLMTAFSADFPIPFSARIMDVLLADQCECALLKVAAAIMKAVESRLQAMSDLEEVLGHLKLEVPAWDEPDLHDLLTAAFTKPWTPRQLSILRSTEGAETVAQAMDRVMNMHEQLSAQPCDDEDNGEESGGTGGAAGGGGASSATTNSGDGEARVAVTVTIPRLHPPPQPSSSFAASPVCGTPVNGGMYGTGSHGGAASDSPPSRFSGGAAAAAVTSAAIGGNSRCSGGGGGAVPAATSILDSVNSGCSNAGCSNGNLLLLQGGTSVSNSPAAWGIPCIHPNVPASPAIQAFRRAHLTSFQAAAANGAATEHYNEAFPSHAMAHNSCGGGQLNDTLSGLDDAVGSASAMSSARDGDIGECSPLQGCYGSGLHRGSDGCSPEEWGDFNAAAVRQQWRSIVRAAPGSTRHVLLHPEELGGGAAANRPWRGTSAAVSAFSSLTAPLTPSSRESSGGSASQPIPVPFVRGGLSSTNAAIGSAFAAAAAAANAAVAALPSAATAAIGKPPLPPRCATLERGGGGGAQSMGPISRLSVVAEDPLAVQMGAVAPAPSPRGSMDLHVLGRSGSQPFEACEQQGFLLYGPNVGGVGVTAGGGSAATATGGGGGGSASCNGDCVSGTASATTGGAMLSPSAISGAVSPQLASPGLLSGWCTSGLAGRAGSGAIGGGSAGGATGSDTPTAGYMPLGFERTISGSLLDYTSGYNAAGLPERSYSLANPMSQAAAAAVAAAAAAPLGFQSPRPNGAPSTSPLASGEQCSLQSYAPSHTTSQQLQEQEPQQSDMATDIAGDILRMLSAVDTGNAHAAYDPRVILGESMYADSPNKEEHKLVREGSETLRHVPSSSALADMAAEDLAKAQEVAARVRQELEAQLQQQRASERASGLTSGSEHAASASVFAPAATSISSVAVTTAAAGGAAEEPSGPSGGLMEAHLAEAAVEAGAAAMTAVAAATVAEAAAAAGKIRGGGAAAVPGTDMSLPAPSSTTVASGAAAGGNGGGGGGVEEVVFKRPTLYVDGIPMFDPKSLMADYNEAQVMFTPTVSPGASSYADPVLSGFTPTGDATTPAERDGDRDGDGISEAAAAVTENLDVSHIHVKSSGSGGEELLGAAEAEEVVQQPSLDEEKHCDEMEATVPGSLLTTPAEVELEVEAAMGSIQHANVSSLSVSRADTPSCGMDNLTTSATPAAAATADGEMAAGGTAQVSSAAAGPIPTLPSASEWVDWSQAPPIQVAPQFVLPLSQPTVTSASTSSSAVLSAAASPRGPDLEAHPSPPPAAIAAVPPPQPLPPSQPNKSISQASCPLDHDLIDMASPVQPLPPSIASHQTHGSRGAGAAGASDKIMNTPNYRPTSTGTGLSPEPATTAAPPPSPPHLQFHVVNQPTGSFSDLAAAGGSRTPAPVASRSSSPSPAPYGLLPMASSTTHCVPIVPTISLATSTTAGADSVVGSGRGSNLVCSSFATMRSTSFGGGLRTELSSASYPRCDPEGVTNVQADSPGAVMPYHSSDESDRCGGDDEEEDGDRDTDLYGGGQMSMSALESPQNQVCESPEWFRELEPSLSGADGAAAAAAHGNGGGGGGQQTVDADAKLIGDFCTAPGLRVMAEVMLPESSAQEPDSSQTWDSPSSSVAGGGSAAAAGAITAVHGTRAAFTGITSSSFSDGSSPRQQQRQLESLVQGRMGSGNNGQGKGKEKSSGGGGGSMACGGDDAASSSWSASLGVLEDPPGLGGSGAASRGSFLDHQSSLEVDMEGEEGESSPFRAALSPSLAHHIMSAYLRSEQHQQQQEQRELEERLREQERLLAYEQQQQQQQHLLLKQQMVVGAGAPPVVALRPSALGLPETVAATTTSACEIAAGPIAASATTLPPLLSQGSSAAVTAAATTASTAAAAVTSVGHGALGDLHLPCGAPILSSATSGATSPVLGSPGRPVGGYGGPYGNAMTGLLQQQPYLMQQNTSKVLTPFALSSGDPSSCRLTAELQQVIPLPLQSLLVPSDATSLPLQLGSNGCSMALDGRSHVSGFTSLRCTGSGDGEQLSGTVAAGSAVGGFGSGGLSCGIGIARTSASGAPPTVPLLALGAVEGCASNIVVPGSAALALATETITAMAPGGLLHPPTGQTSGFRSCSGSAGGAALQLLPPPPPPQVPLCTARLEAACAPLQPMPPPSLQLPLPLPPVLCSSSATVTAVAEGEGGGGVTACTPVATIASSGCTAGITTVHPPAPPTWTATFDGVDDTPTGDNVALAEATEAKRIRSNGPEPRTLSSAFAAEADTPSPPSFSTLDSSGGGSRVAAATTAGIATSPEARAHLPDMVRRMSIEVATSSTTTTMMMGGAPQGPM